MSIDADDARAMPGVVAVFTAADLGLPPYEGLMQLNDAVQAAAARRAARCGSSATRSRRSSRRRAPRRSTRPRRSIVDYDPLPAVVDPEAALAPGAPLQFEELGSNLAAAIEPRAQGDVLEGADVVVRAASRTSASR